MSSTKSDTHSVCDISPSKCSPGTRGSEAEDRSRLGVALEEKGSQRGWIEAVLASILVGVFFTVASESEHLNHFIPVCNRIRQREVPWSGFKCSRDCPKITPRAIQ